MRRWVLRQVYLISDESGRVKIGASDDPAARLAQLQTANPEKLTLLAMCHGGEEFERVLHERFDYCRLSGEWFDSSVMEIDDLSIELDVKSEMRHINWTQVARFHRWSIEVAIVRQWGVKATHLLQRICDSLLERGVTERVIVEICCLAVPFDRVHYALMALDYITQPLADKKKGASNG